MDEIIYLLKTINTENKIGDAIKELIKEERYAKKLEIGQREFYQAATTGLKPEVKFEIWKLKL